MSAKSPISRSQPNARLNRAAAYVLLMILLAAPAMGNKPLYLYTDPGNLLSRTPPTGIQLEVGINGNGAQETWTLTPATAAAITLDGSAPIQVELYMSRTGFGDSRRLITIDLFSTSLNRSIGSTSRLCEISVSPPQLQIFSIHLVNGEDVVLLSGDTLQLTITNASGDRRQKIFVFPTDDTLLPTDYSQVDLAAKTVIQVATPAFYDAPYPTGAPVSSAAPGDTVYVRATVSDPFGSFDIAGAVLNVLDPNGLPAAENVLMNAVYDSGAAEKEYEATFTFPAGAASGNWAFRVTAEEGTEGTVRHTGEALLYLPGADILLLKSVTALTDPVNGGSNAKAIPGAVMLYTIMASNQGSRPADLDSVSVTDRIPTAGTALLLGDPAAGPVTFTGPGSGLTYTFGGWDDPTDDIEFSTDGVDWNYTPVPDGYGADPLVTHIRVNPKGTFYSLAESPTPSFTLYLRVRVK